MLIIGTLLISMLGQTVYAANKEERRLARQYSSYKKRVKKVREKAHRATVHLDEDDFKVNPRGLVRYKLEKAVEGRNLPVESPKLVEQIHGLKRLHAYVHEEISHTSVSTKVAPVELEPVPVVFHADLVPRPPQEPSLCSDCVIL